MSSEAVRILVAEVVDGLATGRITLDAFEEFRRYRDANQLKTCETLTLAKFDGDIEPGAVPVEVVRLDPDGRVTVTHPAREG